MVHSLLELYFCVRKRRNTMSEQTEKKKISLQDAIKQQLENKKANQGAAKGSGNWSNATKSLKSQQTKKINNQRKRQGV